MTNDTRGRVAQLAASATAAKAGDSVLAYYEACLAAHGDTAAGAGWPNDTDRQTRFAVILDIMRATAPAAAAPLVVCDLGCGTGEFLRAARLAATQITYIGADRSRAALEQAREKFSEGTFLEIDVLSASDEELERLRCDYLVLNGLFTVKGHLSDEQMWAFMTATIERLWPFVRRGVIFNVMSTIVDWTRGDLFHVGFDALAAWLHGLAGRSIGFRADYGLYEYMAYAVRPVPEHAMPAVEDEIVRSFKPLLPATAALVPYLREIDRARWYSNHGPLSHALELRLSSVVGRDEQVFTTASSGTAALTGAILGRAGRATRDRPLCLCPGYTFVATAAAIVECGYEPYLIDVDEATWALDPISLRSHPALANAGLVVVVAPYGRAVSQQKWLAFERATGVAVVIDGAAMFEHVITSPSEQIGEIPVALSLHATKTFSAAEGGLVVSTNRRWLEGAGRALNMGVMGRRESSAPGINGKMSEYHAAVGLASLDAWPQARASLARTTAAYRRHAQAHALDGELILAPDIASCYAIFHARDRAGADRAAVRLTGSALEHRRWYGGGLHREPWLAGVARDPLPITERLAETLLGVPMAPDLSDDTMRRVAGALSRGVD